MTAYSALEQVICLSRNSPVGIAEVERSGDVWMKPVVAVQLSAVSVCRSVKQSCAENEYLCSAETL